ncbi:gamma-glutamyl-gamma-aminobutyrate hydrolase family protein [Roseibium sediminis]|uniref:gamma-glutamyl-gamma-aminobutyrate hydrolase family protein n=1 Tax=Roseibium sediminis TaxID=1775174 RepID=UPI00123E1531|nr:gamma-glutamyl-gamma-aminobutyrate hydrolase family protein [Roseibium sediminis]
MSKPLILITSDVKPVDGYKWHAAPSTYLNAVLKGADAIPVILPSLGDDLALDDVLDRVDGVLATGSRSNVYPELYGEVPTEENGPYDRERDATTLPLLRRAVARGIPVFAICRGMQELNVAFGGSLLTEIQELDGRMDHRAAVSEDQNERFKIAHPIEIKDDSKLADVLGNEPVEVNSLHRQALGELGSSLVVEARAADGTIEAVSVDGAPGYVLATQWHPEFWVATDSPSKKLFKAFGEAARAYRAQR